MKNKLFLWIILIVIIVLAIGAIGYASWYAGSKDREEAKTETQEEANKEESQEGEEGTGDEEQERHCLTNPASGSGNITITSPTAQTEVTSPVVVKGKANVFEGSFLVRLMDCQENEITEVIAQTRGGDIGQMNPYSLDLTFGTAYSGQDAYIEAYDLSAKDGSVQDLIQIPVKLK